MWFIHKAVRSSYYEASTGRITDEKLTGNHVAAYAATPLYRL
jgi:hypothetical protein